MLFPTGGKKMFKPTLKKKSSINIIPMIDVIFFLLVFFMLFTSFRTNPYGIDLQLPKAVTVSKQSEQNLIIDIDESGQVFYDGDKLPLSKIAGIVENKHSNNKELIVIINADQDTRYKSIVSVMDNIRQVGVYRIALAAEEKKK